MAMPRDDETQSRFELPMHFLHRRRFDQRCAARIDIACGDAFLITSFMCCIGIASVNAFAKRHAMFARRAEESAAFGISLFNKSNW
jgi:hypothetical protein